MSFVTNEKLVSGAPNEVFPPTVNDETLAIIKSFPRLEHLYIEDSKVTDTGIAHVADLRNLRRLTLIRTSVTEASLKHLKGGLKHLRSLRILGIKISKGGLEALTENMAIGDAR